MNTEALIELISKEVIEQLNKGGFYKDTPVVREQVLVVGNSVDKSKLTRLLRNVELSFLCDLDHANPDDFDHVVIADLPNKLLADIAMGLERGHDGCIILESLMLGKSVYLLEEGIAYRRYSDTAKPALIQLFQQKEQALLGYGVTLVKGTELAQTLTGKNCHCDAGLGTATPLQEENPPCNHSSQTGTFNINNRVVRECDLLSGIEQGYNHFTVINNALLTPLAKDCVRLQELQVIRAPVFK